MPLRNHQNISPKADSEESFYHFLAYLQCGFTLRNEFDQLEKINELLISIGLKYRSTCIKERSVSFLC
jgi:hypothetical protein